MLNWTKRIFAATLISGVIASGGYGISVLFNEKEKTIDLKDESKILWEFVQIFEGGVRTCDLFYENKKIAMKKIEDYEKFFCKTAWAEKIIREQNNQTGLWIRGEEQAIINSINKSELLIDNFVLDEQDRKMSKVDNNVEDLVSKLKQKCQKIIGSRDFEYKCEFPSVSKKR